VIHRGLRIDQAHPLAGTAPGVRNPLRFSRTPVDCQRSPPLLGADTASVLGERLGLGADALDTLRRNGIIL
jgi:crotonobetainyl-CoA:carnitine CoA-transferase CaiB-like acyl-CoA transferase